MFGKASLLGVGQMIGFFALYLETGLGLSASAASSASGAFALGSLVASLLGSRVYHTLSPKAKTRAVVVANLVGVGIPALLCGHALKLLPAALFSRLFVLALLTLWGGAWALAFYVPPGVIALSIGGKDHAALVTNVADGAGFGVAAIFSIFAMDLGRKGAWGPIMALLASFASIALVSLRHAMIKADKEAAKV